MGTEIQIPKNIVPFVAGVISSFKILCNIEVKPSQPYTKTEKKTNNDVSGIVGLVGESYLGTFSISFPKPVALLMVKAILTEEHTELNDSVSDCVAELTNIVFGNAKRGLSELGISLEMSIPYTIIGKDHLINHNFNGPFMVIPFNCEFGIFFIEVGMKKKD